MSRRRNRGVHVESLGHAGIRVAGARRHRSLAMAAIRQSLSRLYEISVVLGNVLRQKGPVVCVVVQNFQLTCAIFLRYVR